MQFDKFIINFQSVYHASLCFTKSMELFNDRDKCVPNSAQHYIKTDQKVSKVLDKIAESFQPPTCFKSGSHPHSLSMAAIEKYDSYAHSQSGHILGCLTISTTILTVIKTIQGCQNTQVLCLYRGEQLRQLMFPTCNMYLENSISPCIIRTFRKGKTIYPACKTALMQSLWRDLECNFLKNLKCIQMNPF